MSLLITSRHVRAGSIFKDVCKRVDFRLLSTSSTEQEDEPKEIKESSIKTIYKANPSKANFPRGLLAFSTVHTSYWAWYVLDFMPTIQSTLEDPTTVDNTIGYFGLGLSVFMSIGSMMYPKSLVNEIAIDETNRILKVKTFTLPFVTPSSPIEYEIGNLVIDSPNDVTKILTQYNGLMSGFSGHMALHAEGKKTNLLMNFKEDSHEEILDNELLLKTLTPGQAKDVKIVEKSNVKSEPKSLKKKRKIRR